MPIFSRALEKTLRRALSLANERRHEYATLEHLLLALIDDVDAAAVLRACGVDLDGLRKTVVHYLDTELENLVVDSQEEAKATNGFQRVVQRAAFHVQSSGREEVTGANVLVAIFAERETHAAYFLQEQDMTRYDAVNYISHGIAKRPGHADPSRLPRGTDEEHEFARFQGVEGQLGFKEKGRRLGSILRQPQSEGARGAHRSAHWPRGRGPAHNPGAVPPAEEQSAPGRGPGGRQDGDRRGPGAQDRQLGRARGARRIRPYSRSTWARCSPGPAIAATSRSA